MTTQTQETTSSDPWQAVLTWLTGAGITALQLAGILLGCLLAGWLLRLIIRRVVRRIVTGAKTRANVDDTQALDRSPLSAARVVQRTRTLGSLLQNAVNIALVVLGFVLCIQVVNEGALGSFALITAAVGAGLGIGAQNVVKDVLSGLFLVMEDQLGIGDVVDLGLATGVVEYVSVRVTHVRDVNGTLWYVRNGEILRVGNMSQGWSRVIVDVTAPRESDIAGIEELILETATTLSKAPVWRSRVVGTPEMWGLESASDTAIVVRVVMRTRAAAKDDVAQELRRRLTDALDESGVDGAGIASVTLSGSDDAFRVRGANPPKTKPHPVQDGEHRGMSWRARAKHAKRQASQTPNVVAPGTAAPSKGTQKPAKGTTEEKPAGPTEPNQQ